MPKLTEAILAIRAEVSTGDILFGLAPDSICICLRSMHILCTHAGSIELCGGRRCAAVLFVLYHKVNAGYNGCAAYTKWRNGVDKELECQAYPFCIGG